MNTLPFKQVDVFTQKPFLGNPVAVVLGAEHLDTAAMRCIAAWTNLSETAFVLPPWSSAADYHLRIFTPQQELSFAGHPTIGSAHAMLESGFTAALADSQSVALLEPNLESALQLSVATQAAGGTIFARADDRLARMHLRSFAPALGVAEIRCAATATPLSWHI